MALIVGLQLPNNVILSLSFLVSRQGTGGVANRYRWPEGQTVPHRHGPTIQGRLELCGTGKSVYLVMAQYIPKFIHKVYVLLWFGTDWYWWISSISLTFCSLVTPFGNLDLGQHWLRWWLVVWRYQDITRTIVDFSMLRFGGIHLKAVSWVLKFLFCIMSWKIILSKLLACVPGVNELRITPLALGESHCCPSASEVTLKDMAK